MGDNNLQFYSAFHPRQCATKPHNTLMGWANMIVSIPLNKKRDVLGLVSTNI